ncbi:hypothetical protein AB2L27_02995 [Kineococcus sp. LSe6-4]|uniref:Uncharacterized protein n=1 Tax=Kineococcus halophytocola TaxID=3234027 RepID=A0ABV4GZV4_9ACTN
MSTSAAPGARVVGFTREAGWCQAPGCAHPVPEGAALLALPDGRFTHYGRSCVRRVLGLALTVEDLLAVEARRHAAFVVALAHVHAAFVAEDPGLCAELLAGTGALRPATVAERVVLESARARLELVLAAAASGPDAAVAGA